MAHPEAADFLLAASPVASALLSGDTRVLTVNIALAALVQESPDGLTGRPLSALVHVDDAAQLEADVLALAPGTGLVQDVRLRPGHTGEPAEHWVALSVSRPHAQGSLLLAQFHEFHGPSDPRRPHPAPHRDDLARRHRIEVALRSAFEGGRLRLVYQPVLALDSGRSRAVEALLRWDDPVLDGFSVQDVVATAEHSPLIDDVGAWVLQTALADATAWRAAGADQVCVNVSPRQLLRSDFPARVLAALAAHGVPGQELCLEITETALADNVDLVASALAPLRASGVSVAIDDFGTGYASLTYLARFPVNIVKVDQSFVGGLGSEPVNAAIVGSIVTLAHALGMRVIAEGVEALPQLELLLEAGCDEAQGFLFSQPMPVQQLAGATATLVPWPMQRRGATPGEARLLSATSPSRRYRLLLDLAREVTASLDLDRVLEETFRALRQLLVFTGGSIQLVEDDHIRLAATDPPATPEALRTRIPLGHGIGGGIAVTGRPRYLPDILADPEVSPVNRSRSSSSGVRSYYGVPLVTEGRILGVLQVDSTKVDAFSEEDRLVVLAFTPIVAAALQNARLFERQARHLLAQTLDAEPPQT